MENHMKTLYFLKNYKEEVVFKIKDKRSFYPWLAKRWTITREFLMIFNGSRECFAFEK